MASRELENSFIQRQSESSNLGELWQREKAKRRLAETALLESEKRFRATFETAAMAIAHISLDGQLLVVNPKLSDLLGYTSEELLNLTFDAIVRPDAITSASLSEKRLDWDELARSLQPSGESPAIGRELCCIRKDGSPIWVKISLSLVARKEEAENPSLTCDFSLPPASYAIAVIQDISDRISLEQELARQKQLFNAFFASAPVGLAILDDQLNYVLVNETLAEINGVSVEDHLGKNLKDVVPDCATTLEPLLKNILLTGEPILDVENSGNLPGKSDVQTWISSQFAIPGEEGKPQGIGAVVVDITKRKQAEEALRKSEEQYRTLARNFPNGAIALFDSDMRYTLFEGTELTKIGLSKEFIEGKTLQEVFPPEMCAIVEPMYRAALMGTTLIFEAPYREQIYLWHILPISNDRGKILSGMAMSQNITLAKQIEQVWRQQAQIIDQLRLAVVKIDFAGVAIGWNKGAENLFGYQASEVIGQTISFIDSPESSEFWQQLIRQVLKKGTHELELKMQQKSGEDLFVLFSFSLMKNERGALVGIIGAGMDVTARKRAEQERARLTDILEKTTDYVGIADVKGRATYINKAGRKMLGIDENEDIKNLYIRDFMASSVTENALNKMLLIASKNGAWSGESVIRHRSGTEIPVSQAIVAHKSENGVVEFISAICRDISDRKQAEEELRKKEQHLRAVLENMPVMMIAFDRHKTIIVWNRECERVTGYSAEEIVGNSNVWELLYPDPAYRTQMFDQWQERGNVCRNWEWQLTAKDGNIKTVAWSNISENFPIPGWGGWGIGVDITPRKQTESALQQTSASLQEYATQLEQTLHELQQTQAQLVQTEKMSSLGQLVAGVAHEINNPVNFIYGNLAHAKEYTQDLLNLLALYQQHYPDPPQEIREATEEIDLDFIIEDLPRLLGSMQVGAERICQIVLSLRNFSRLEEAEMKPVDIHEGIESTLLILQNRLKERGEHPGIQVIKEYGNLPEVECYAGQMNQVFMNILANAIDAIEEYNHRRSSAEIQAQPSTIAIRTELKGKRKLELGENTLAVIRISDNGPGMSEDVRSRLFDPFFTTKPVGKGTGLGLAIGYQIVVEKHGGNLQCNSAPGQGAEFVIEIPIRQQVLRTVQGQ